METLFESIKKGFKFELIDESIVGFQGRYLGNFLEFNDDSIVTSIPKMNGRDYTFKRGENAVLYVHTDDGVYNIECEVLDFGDDYCKLSMPTVMKHSQRREFLRANLQLKAILNFRNRDYENETREIKTMNACGRGICFDSKEDLSYAKDIAVELFLSDKIVETDAEIVYVKPVEKHDGLVFLTALTFTTISDSDINAIVRECFLYKLKNDER